MKKVELVMANKNANLKYVVVTSRRAKSYLNSIIPRGHKLKEYCENCGRIFGKQENGFRFEKPVMFKTYFVCPDCKQDLQRELDTNVQTASPNINDL